jgi:hypothetical protein
MKTRTARHAREQSFAAVEDKLRADLSPLRLAGASIGGAFAVIGLFCNTMRFRHDGSLMLDRLEATGK